MLTVIGLVFRKEFLVYFSTSQSVSKQLKLATNQLKNIFLSLFHSLYLNNLLKSHLNASNNKTIRVSWHMTNCSQNFKLFMPIIDVFIIWFSICLNFSSIHFQSRTRRFQMEVLLMPTVGRATDVNMNLFISIPDNIRMTFKICPLLETKDMSIRL